MVRDLVVVGAGPAGISAGLWAARLGLGALVLEAGPTAGGQLHLIHYHPSDYAGAVPGDGGALARAMCAQLEASGVTVERDAAATALDLERGQQLPVVLTADGRRFEAAAVLVATGARRRRLGVPGERELEGCGVSYSATRDKAQLAGRPVVVVGGGDAAFENALLLAEAGCAVSLVSRATPQARAEFRERVAMQPHIERFEDTRVTAILGDGRVRGVGVESRRGRGEIPAEAVVVKIGMMPNSEWCARSLDLDPAGYVRVDASLRTSAARVWAAGDITRPLRASIASAVGAGATALAAIRAALRPG